MRCNKCHIDMDVIESFDGGSRYKCPRCGTERVFSRGSFVPSGWRSYRDVLGLDKSLSRSRYASVQRWLDLIVAGGSLATKDKYLYSLAEFCAFTNSTPDGLVGEPVEKIEDLVKRFASSYLRDGKVVKARQLVGALRSFFRENRKKLELRGYMRMMRSMKRRKEYVPSVDEVYKIANAAASLRDRAVILCLMQSGLRNTSLRALTYGDLKDQIESGRVPIRVHVGSHLEERVPGACKYNEEYWTFFGAEASEALQMYLRDRKRKWGSIADDDFLFPPEARNVNPRRAGKPIPMSASGLQHLVRRTARRAGFENIRVHTFRKTFRSVLNAGYANGGQMDEDTKEYLMGHRLPSEKRAYFNVNLDEIEGKYTRLNFSQTGAIPLELRRRQVLDTVKLLGFDEERVKRVEEALAKYESVDEAMEEIRKLSLGSGTIDREEETNGGQSRYEARIIAEEDLIDFVEAGWGIVKELSNGRIVVRR